MNKILWRVSDGKFKTEYIRANSLDEAKEIFKVREVLEGLIAREATKNITKEQLTRLEDTLELMSRAAQDNRKQDAILYGSEFHHYLYEPSRIQTAVQFLTQINSRLERYRRLGGYKNPEYLPMLPVSEHQEIFQAIKSGNAQLAEKVMRTHISRSLIDTIKTLEKIEML